MKANPLLLLDLVIVFAAYTIIGSCKKEQESVSDYRDLITGYYFLNGNCLDSNVIWGAGPCYPCFSIAGWRVSQRNLSVTLKIEKSNFNDSMIKLKGVTYDPPGTGRREDQDGIIFTANSDTAIDGKFVSNQLTIENQFTPIKPINNKIMVKGNGSIANRKIDITYICYGSGGRRYYSMKSP